MSTCVDLCFGRCTYWILIFVKLGKRRAEMHFCLLKIFSPKIAGSRWCLSMPSYCCFLSRYLKSSCRSSSESSHLCYHDILILLLPKSPTIPASLLQSHFCCLGPSPCLFHELQLPCLCAFISNSPSIQPSKWYFYHKDPLGHFQTQISPVAPISWQRESNSLYLSNTSWLDPSPHGRRHYYHSVQAEQNYLEPSTLYTCSLFSPLCFALSTLPLMSSICLSFKHYSFSQNAELTSFSPPLLSLLKVQASVSDPVIPSTFSAVRQDVML